MRYANLSSVMFQFNIIEISFVDTKYFEEIFGMENIIIDLQKGKDVAPATPLENQILKIFILFPEDIEGLRNKFKGGKGYVIVI